MNVRSALIFVTFATFSLAVAAQNVTEIYKCTDAGGRPLYTSDKKDTAGKKCELVSREVNVVAPQKPAVPQKPGAAGPKETGADRASARERQRNILESELKTEEGMLAKARQELAEQEGVRTGGERNYARVLERLQPFKDNVELHEKNVETLKRELGNLR
jgi:hypothetical protein